MSTESNTPGSDIRTGWLCPGCGTIYSPEIPKCETCKLAVLTRIYQCVEDKPKSTLSPEMDISLLRIPKRTLNALRYFGKITTVGELCLLQESRLESIRGLAKVGRESIVAALREHGLSLRSESK